MKHSSSNYKKQNIMIKKIFIFTLLATTLFSCRRSVRDEDRDTKAAEDFALADVAYNDISNLLTEVMESESGLRAASLNLGCATVTVDTLAFPMTVTIDFGTTNCVGGDGRSRRGIINATFTGKYRDSLTVITITPNNYYLNDHKIEGTKVVTNKGHNSNGNLWYTVVITNAVITAPDGSWNVSFNSNRTREWIAGEPTAVLSDDVYEISGTMDGYSRTGNHFTASTTTPVRFELSCAWIVSGIIVVAPDNVSPRTINFGSGTCDNDATVEVNGNTYDVEMN
jgi:hypothetical protein